MYHLDLEAYSHDIAPSEVVQSADPLPAGNSRPRRPERSPPPELDDCDGLGEAAAELGCVHAVVAGASAIEVVEAC
jgi:hypothetical protein